MRSMRADQAEPADTTMMRIVHDALRRDLERARSVIDRSPGPADRQRVAIAEHLDWMMAFLEAHHRSEDLGLYAMVRERDPDAAAVLDEMERDHVSIASEIARVHRAAAAYGVDDTSNDLAESLDSLREALLPHLRREEDIAMPLVSRAITRADWTAIEQRHNLDGKSSKQLAREGHWLIDGATPDDRARVIGLVPLVPRLAMLYGFGPAYRRRRDAAWRPRHRVQRNGSIAVLVDADIDAVWNVVRDPTRVGEWSHECVACRWIDGANDARPGARFRGRNRQGVFAWGRICEIVTAEPHEIVWRTVPTRRYGDSTVWALRLARSGSQTRIEQTFQVVRGTWLEPVFARLLPAHRDRTRALEEDLRRIGELAAASDPSATGSSTRTWPGGRSSLTAGGARGRPAPPPDGR